MTPRNIHMTESGQPLKKYKFEGYLILQGHVHDEMLNLYRHCELSMYISEKNNGSLSNKM